MKRIATLTLITLLSLSHPIKSEGWTNAALGVLTRYAEKFVDRASTEVPILVGAYIVWKAIEAPVAYIVRAPEHYINKAQQEGLLLKNKNEELNGDVMAIVKINAAFETYVAGQQKLIELSSSPEEKEARQKTLEEKTLKWTKERESAFTTLKHNHQDLLRQMKSKEHAQSHMIEE